MLSSRVLDVRPESPVIVGSNLVEVGRDVEAVGLSSSQSLGKAEQAGTERSDALCIQDLGCDHGRSDSGDLDAELVTAHANLLELLSVRTSVFQNCECVVGECRGDLHKNSSSNERDELGSELGRLSKSHLSY